MAKMVRITVEPFNTIINSTTNCRLSWASEAAFMPALTRILWNSGKVVSPDGETWEVREDLLNMLELLNHSKQWKHNKDIAEYLIERVLGIQAKQYDVIENIETEATRKVFQQLKTAHKLASTLLKGAPVSIKANTFDLLLKYDTAFLVDQLTIGVSSSKSRLTMEFVFPNTIPDVSLIMEIIENPLNIIRIIGRGYRETRGHTVKGTINDKGVTIGDFALVNSDILKALSLGIPLETFIALGK